MKERLSVEFRINLDDIIDQPRTGEVPVEELQEKSDRMKKRMENVNGSFNVENNKGTITTFVTPL